MDTGNSLSLESLYTQGQSHLLIYVAIAVILLVIPIAIIPSIYYKVILILDDYQDNNPYPWKTEEAYQRARLFSIIIFTFIFVIFAIVIMTLFFIILNNSGKLVQGLGLALSIALVSVCIWQLTIIENKNEWDTIAGWSLCIFLIIGIFMVVAVLLFLFGKNNENEVQKRSKTGYPFSMWSIAILYSITLFLAGFNMVNINAIEDANETYDESLREPWNVMLATVIMSIVALICIAGGWYLRRKGNPKANVSKDVEPTNYPTQTIPMESVRGKNPITATQPKNSSMRDLIQRHPDSVSIKSYSWYGENIGNRDDDEHYFIDINGKQFGQKILIKYDDEEGLSDGDTLPGYFEKTFSDSNNEEKVEVVKIPLEYKDGTYYEIEK
jgi:hypothetical protein